MPIYMYECPKCGTGFEMKLALSEFTTVQVCPECGSAADQVVAPTSFVLKGDGWPGKALRVKEQMKKRRQKVGQKQKNHVAAGQTLQPNVDGEQTDTWADAQKMAASKGKDTSSYDTFVHQEQQ